MGLAIFFVRHVEFSLPSSKNLIGEVVVPEEIKNWLALPAHLRSEPVGAQIFRNTLTIYNKNLDGYLTHLAAPPAITVTNVPAGEGEILFSNKYYNGQVIAPAAEGELVSAKLYASALVSMASTVSEKTFQGLIHIDRQSWLLDANALYGIGTFVLGLMTDSRTQLRTAQAA